MKRSILSFFFVLGSIGLSAQMSGGEIWNKIYNSFSLAYGEPDTLYSGIQSETILVAIWFENNLPNEIKGISLSYSTRKFRDRNIYIELNCALKRNNILNNFQQIASLVKFNNGVFKESEIHMTNDEHTAWLEHYKNSNFPGLEYMFGKDEEGFSIVSIMIYPNFSMPPGYNEDFFENFKF